MKDNKIRKYDKYGWFVRFACSILRLWTPKPQLIIEGEIPSNSIIIANHAGAAGPIYITLFFPGILVPWSAYQMSGNYKERWNYLYYVFYRQKKKYGKLASLFLATIFGLVSKLLYDGMRVIPTYPDPRFRKTIKLTSEHLDAGNHVLVFPEDSSDGYVEVAEKYMAGFAVSAISHFKRTGYVVPITPVFADRKSKILVIGKSTTIKELLDKKMDRNRIAHFFLDRTAELAIIAQKENLEIT
ncbi:MAG: hypothetical protein JXR38_00465 [Bacilli bacterium]|nr:hypothetical protein [Bacilli bacterium]